MPLVQTSLESPKELVHSHGCVTMETLRKSVPRHAGCLRAGDDGIAMHGQYYAVADVDLRRQAVTIASNGEFAFDKGDTLTLYGSDTRCKGSAVIVSLHSVGQPDATDGKISENLSDLKPYFYDDCDFMEVGHGMRMPLAPEQPVTEKRAA